MTIFGYARVSTGSQDYQSQVDKLRSAGATKTHREKISGARADRPELRRLIKSLQAGDVMMVTAIDRAARNTRDLLNILDDVPKAGAKFKSLSEPWCDSTSPTGELMITVLAGVATFERHLIQVRTSEGRARAVANGVKLGPKRKLSPAQEQAARDLRLAGKSLSDIAGVLRVSSTTVKRAINRGGRRRADVKVDPPSPNVELIVSDKTRQDAGYSDANSASSPLSGEDDIPADDRQDKPHRRAQS